MNWVFAGLWGMAGGFVVEGLELYAAVRRHGTWPWHVHGQGVRAGPLAYAIAEVIRMLIGGILAGATAASGQVSGPLAAVAIGVAAPVMVDRLTSLLPIPATPNTDTPADVPPSPSAHGELRSTPSSGHIQDDVVTDVTWYELGDQTQVEQGER